MEEKICPVCGCVIASEGYETGGVVFCCESCANDEHYTYSCCDEDEEGRKE